MRNHPGVARRTRVVVVSLATLAVVLSSPVFAQQGRATTSTSIVVSGTIVRENMSPVEGFTVRVVEAKGAGYVMSIGDGGVIENPSQDTDAKGRFSITVKRSLFKNAQEFALLGGFSGQRVGLLLLKGGVLAVKIDATTKEYKLGAITYKR